MKYVIYPNNPQRYATNLRYNPETKKLIWDSARGQDVLIIQTPYGTRVQAILNDLCAGLSRLDSLPSEFTEIEGVDSVWVCHVTAAEKVKNAGCHINEEAKTYTVMSYFNAEDVVQVFASNDQAMIHAFVDVPFEVHIDVSEEVRYEGWFRKKAVPSGFYRLEFPTGMTEKYVSGSICCSIDGFEIPITREMMRNETVYLETNIEPILVAKSNGIRLA